MATLAALENRLAMVEEQSYYEILRVPSGATVADIKAAFHEFALDVHPDRYVDSPAEDAAVAGEIFKRGVESYKVLTNSKMRVAYDEGLLAGQLRYVEGRRAEAQPTSRTLTLEELATTPKAKQHALRADRFLAVGKLDDARIALVSALQDEPDNEELKGRLNGIYAQIAAAPISLDVDYKRGR